MKNFYFPPPFRTILRLTVVCFILLNSPMLFAQVELFSEVDPETLELTTPQEKIIDYAENLPHQDGIEYAEIGDLADIQDNGFLEFSIPGFGATVYTFYAEHVEYKNDVEYVWAGKIDGDQGDFVLYSDSTGKGGFIDLGTDYYSIHPLGGNLVIIVKHDMTAYSETGCAGGGNKSESATLYCEEEDCGAAILDVLILVTSEANTWLDDNYGTFKQFYVWLGANYTNSAFILSGISGKRVRIHIKWDYTPDVPLNPFSIDNSLGNLIFEQEQSGSLKFQYRADVVVMLTKEDFDNAGAANSMDPTDNEKYCIVEVPFLIEPRFTFAHEIAHLFGCDHDPGQASGNEEDCAHGHRLDLGGPTLRPTIMALTAATEHDDFDARILRYSNPDIEFDGVSTGITDERDNARIIQSAFCAVASNQPAPELGVIISGVPVLCLPTGVITGSNTWTANVIPPATGQPGVAPYTYAWYWSPDGILNMSNYLGSGSSVEVNQVFNCPAFWLHVIVSSYDHVEARADFKIWTALCNHCAQERSGAVAIKQKMGQSDDVLVLPNPASDLITLDFEHSVANILSLRVFDQQGLEVLERNIEGQKQVQLDISGLSNGPYFLRFVGRNTASFQKLIIQK